MIIITIDEVNKKELQNTYFCVSQYLTSESLPADTIVPCAFDFFVIVSFKLSIL